MPPSMRVTKESFQFSPSREGGLAHHVVGAHGLHFNSRPRVRAVGERDVRAAHLHNFNSRPRVRAVLLFYAHPFRHFLFQFSPSREGGLQGLAQAATEWIFQFSPSREGGHGPLNNSSAYRGISILALA